MAGQEHAKHQDQDPGPEDDAAAPPSAAPPQASVEEVDALLDEIDDVLEANAEEFVKGFVQKGGQ